MAYRRTRRSSRRTYRSSGARSRSSYRSRARVRRTQPRRAARRGGRSQTIRIVLQGVPATGATAQTAVKPVRARF